MKYKSSAGNKNIDNTPKGPWMSRWTAFEEKVNITRPKGNR